MNCPDIIDLEKYASGDADESLRASIAGHVASCPACQGEVSELKENLKIAGALRRETAGFDFPHVATPPASSEMIGPYRILRALGHGGMGTVYEAQQENPRRVVALKMMRPGLISPSLMARFHHEAQALGRLRHPGIAQIYEAGTHRQNGAPQPYFVMELVRGQSLVKFAEQHKLSRRTRMELMARICDAVHHAHQQGVIHRDLKPDNILIDDSQPDALQPKILDFGVARIIDPESQTATLHTSAGQIVGTVAYMSPEQASAEPDRIDTRSDVYALGVICYQLLSGRLPYRLNTASVAESVRAIVQDEPAPLSSANRSLRGDVTTIVGKALEKDKSRRYQSAAEMAADIRRHLRDEPITAVPPSTIYQLRKFARRNKALVGGVVAAFVLLASGIVGVSIQWRRAEHSARVARSEAAKQAAVNGFLQDMLGAANPRNLTADDRAKGRNVSVLDALNAASKKVDAGSLKDHPEVELAVRKSIAVAYSELGATDAAEKHFHAALDLSKKLFGAQNTDAADVLNSLTILRKEQGRLDEAAELIRQALEMSRKVDGEGHANFATCNDSMGAVLQAQGRYADAEPYFRQAKDLRHKIFGEQSREFTTSLNNLAYVLNDQGKRDEAESLYRQCLAIRRTILADHPDTALALNNLAFIVRGKGNFVEAEALFREALRMRQKTLGEEHPAVGTGLNNLASVLQAAGKLAEAEPLYQQALVISQKFQGPDHPAIASVLNNLGSLKLSAGQLAEAERFFRESLAMRRRVLPETHPAIATGLRNLALVLLDVNRPDDAEPLIAEALVISAKVGDTKSDTAAARALMGRCRLQQRRYDDAEQELLAALDASTARGARESILKNLVKLYTATKQPDRADRYATMLAASRPSSTSLPARTN
jgi:serine/threonine protein kinase/Tfp pilus assembly protein PilF